MRTFYQSVSVALRRPLFFAARALRLALGRGLGPLFRRMGAALLLRWAGAPDLGLRLNLAPLLLLRLAHLLLLLRALRFLGPLRLQLRGPGRLLVLRLAASRILFALRLILLQARGLLALGVLFALGVLRTLQLIALHLLLWHRWRAWCDRPWRRRRRLVWRHDGFVARGRGSFEGFTRHLWHVRQRCAHGWWGGGDRSF